MLSVGSVLPYMKLKLKEKAEAIQLRKQGKTYSEILHKVPVAKSTLSIWLREVGLAKKQFQRITRKRSEASKRGGKARKDQRIELTQKVISDSRSEIRSLSKRERWIIGIALYWAEGSKEKEWRPGSRTELTNSDPLMISVFLKWLFDSCEVAKEDVSFEIYIHEHKKESINLVKKFWSSTTGFPIQHFEKVYWKKNKVNAKRRNIGNLYYGNLRVRVKASSILNRKIAGWTQGIVEQYCRIV